MIEGLKQLLSLFIVSLGSDTESRICIVSACGTSIEELTHVEPRQLSADEWPLLCGHRRYTLLLLLLLSLLLTLYFLRTCCEQALSLAASVCESACLSQKLLIGNLCNVVAIRPMRNARTSWKLVTFDLDLWPWELFLCFFSPGYSFWYEWLDLATSF